MGAKLAASLTGNADSAIILAGRDGQNPVGSRAVVLTTTVGATPSVKLDILGSVDGVTWFHVPYALPATPTSFVTTQITITTADTFIYLLSEPVQPNPYAYVKLAFTLNTNVTIVSSQYFS